MAGRRHGHWRRLILRSTLERRVHSTNAFLLFGTLLVELAMIMILLSRFLAYRVNRIANIVVAVVLTAVSAVSLFVGAPTPVYAFISVVTIATGLAVVWFAWQWVDSPAAKSPRPTPSLVANDPA